MQLDKVLKLRIIANHMTENVEQLCRELIECLQWYVDEDDVNEGFPDNKYWIDGKHRAIRTIKKAVDVLDMGYEYPN